MVDVGASVGVSVTSIGVVGVDVGVEDGLESQAVRIKIKRIIKYFIVTLRLELPRTLQ